MSRKLTNEEYEKTLSYKFSTWLSGSKDPYLGNVEMKAQKEISESELEKKQIKAEKFANKVRAYQLEKNKEIKGFNFLYRLFSVIFCVFLVVMLAIGVADLPPFGAASNPVNNEVSQRYIENGLQETGAVNIVTGMILDYRAFDTLGESHVLFIATCTVLILLRKDRKNDELDDEDRDRRLEPKNDVILQTAARFLVPLIVIFGIYIILCGHLGPGGGFSGGAVIGAGIILYVTAFGFEKTEKFFTAKTYKIMSFLALACYSASKCYSFYTGANHLHSIIPLGTAGNIISSGLILVLNICVGVVVSGTMYAFYCMFRKGDF